ncbi:MAG: class I SAM-dependent methyltransferase [Planctomycetota bacterium]
MNGSARPSAASPPPRRCPLCGPSRAQPIRGAGSGAAPRPVRCPECRLVYIDPLPAAALDPRTYGAAYYEPWQSRREQRARRLLWRRRLAQVEALARGGALLDVGCGDGLFLQVAREAGWRVEGIEFSPEGARRAAERLGRPVAVGDLARENLLPGPFAVVTLWHVLEHLPQPALMLEAARRRLAPAGLLVAAVPNLDNLPMQAAGRCGSTSRARASLI